LVASRAAGAGRLAAGLGRGRTIWRDATALSLKNFVRQSKDYHQILVR
jgi:hypothetical protein